MIKAFRLSSKPGLTDFPSELLGCKSQAQA